MHPAVVDVCRQSKSVVEYDQDFGADCLECEGSKATFMKLLQVGNDTLRICKVCLPTFSNDRAAPLRLEALGRKNTADTVLARDIDSSYAGGA